MATIADQGTDARVSGASLADDLHRTHQCEQQHAIPVEIRPLPAGDELASGFGGLDHVADADDVFRPHTVLPRRPTPRSGNAG